MFCCFCFGPKDQQRKTRPAVNCTPQLNWWTPVVVIHSWRVDCLTCSGDSCPCYLHLGLPVRNPLPQSPAQPPSFPPSPLRSLGILCGLPAAPQSPPHSPHLPPSPCLLWRRHTAGRWIPYPCVRARLSAPRSRRVCGCLFACAPAWGRGTCSVARRRWSAASSRRRTCGAEVTAQAQCNTSPAANACFSILRHLEIGGRGDLNTEQRLRAPCQRPTAGLHVRNGRSVQSQEVGLRYYSSARRPLLLAARLSVCLFFPSSVLTKKCACVWYLRAVRVAVIRAAVCVEQRQ